MRTTTTKTICMCIDKGGAGKSACTIGLAYRLSQDGYSVLAIDTDPQGNLTDNLSVNISELTEQGKTLYDALSPDCDVKDAIAPTPYENLYILASDNRLNSKIQELESQMGSFVFPYRDMMTEIKKMKKFDFVLIDTRPSVGAENSQVFIASDCIIVPTTTGSRSVNAIWRVGEAIQRCNETFQNCNIEVLGVIMNQVDVRTQITKQVVPGLREDLQGLLFDTLVPIDESVKKAEQVGVPVQNMYPKSKASIAYDNFAKEVLTRLGKA